MTTTIEDLRKPTNASGFWGVQRDRSAAKGERGRWRARLGMRADQRLGTADSPEAAAQLVADALNHVQRPSAPKPRRTLDHWFEGFRDDSKDPGAAPFIARRKAREQGSRQRPEMEALGFIAADGTPLVAHITGPFEFKGSHVKEREVAQAFGMMRLYLLSGREPWPIVWNRNDDVFEDMQALAARDGITILNVEQFKARFGLV